jgi:UDP-N-acetylmuramoyl-L-alanyl-D-glutamate--2,6-diaminopimelate ligase
MKPELKRYEFGVNEILEVLTRADLVTSMSPDLTRQLGNHVFSNVAVDSRKVPAHGIFLAYRGVNTDGHDHIPSALSKGIGLLIVEAKEKIPKNANIPWIAVKSGRGAWSYLCALFNGNPQNSLRFFGVTGTNGKTSTVWILKELLAKEGVPCLSVGTLGSFLGDEPIESTHTTPDPDILYNLFALAVARGIGIVLMEVSSHSLAQAKLLPIKFEGAGFTSFSRDHLDFHKDMNDYFATKMLLFREYLAKDHCCAVAASIDRSAEIANTIGIDSLYGFAGKNNLAASIRILSSDANFTQIEISKNDQIFSGKIPYFGSIGIENFVCAFLLAEKCLGRFPDPKVWPLLTQVPGRLQRLVSTGTKPAVFIDYAHTPDALEKVLKILRPLVSGNLLVVMGCGGNRDQGKRPLMGKIAEDLADSVILTSDNPRDEDPNEIVAHITAGLHKPERALVEIDRKKAIQKAISLAGKDDCILIAGKGHETYQLIRGTSYPFDDRSIAQEILGLGANQKRGQDA